MRRDGMWVKQIMGRQGIPCAVGMAFFIAKFINFDFGKTNDNIFQYRIHEGETYFPYKQGSV